MSAPPDATDGGSSHARYLASLPRRTYALRTLGMGLGALPVLLVLRELDAAPVAWAWAVFACLVWPHAALLLALRSRDPFRAELRNFVFDSFLAGSLAPLMHFNVLPSVVLVSVVMADKLNTGIRGLWLRSLPGMFVAVLAGGALTGFDVQPESSLAVVVASLPILVIHTLAVALTSYRLVRKVQAQNLQLEAVSRTDALTGVHSRGHWDAMARGILERAGPARPGSLLVIDVDDFKSTNDTYGHVRGDDVLRGIGAILLHHGGDGVSGRLGGDEFALAVPLGAEAAQALAETLRAEAQALRFEAAPELHCSISIGVATTPVDGGLREWLEAADHALYAAKHHGRNRAEAAGSERRRSAVE
jgi:diguanylate cyclase